MPIVGMNYYDPFVADVWFATNDAGQVQANANLIAGFNTFLEKGYPVPSSKLRVDVCGAAARRPSGWR
jgi:hypothetical protein